MKIFDVANSNRMGMFIMAIDKEDALKIAKEFGHVKNLNKASVLDLTNELINEEGIKELLENKCRGQLAKEIPAMTLMDLFSSIEKPDPGKWILIWGANGTNVE